MKRIRKTQATLNLPTLKLEGGLFLPDQLEKAAQGHANAQLEADYGTPKGIKLKGEYSRAFQIACAQWQHFAAQTERADVDAAQLTTAFVHELLHDAASLAAFNGFLLAANLDALFDRFLVSFDDTGHLLTSARLSQSDLHGLGIHPGMALRWLASEHQPYLQWHRARFLPGA